MSAALASSMLAASGLPLAMICSATPAVAAPLTATVRLPPVMPSGTTSLSPWTTRMRSMSMPNLAELRARSPFHALAVRLVADIERQQPVVGELGDGGLGRAARAFLDIGRHADAAPLAFGRRLRAAGGEALPVGLLHALAHHRLEV